MHIVGAGQAGGCAALALRERGWDGPITLIGEECEAPYERPPLSKGNLTGDASPAFVASRERLAAARVAFIEGVSVTALDRDARALTLSDGRVLTYHRLLLATGASPRALPVPGCEHALVLRTHREAMALRARLVAGARLVVIGAGFIGLEVAASARSLGCEVTVVDFAPRVLMRGVPAEIAALVAARHEREGVRLRLGVGIDRIERDEAETRVVLSGGEVLACDVLLAGIGVLPQTRLAMAAGLAVGNGISVDARLRTSDPAIFAAGDCTSFPSMLSGAALRLESWRNAQDQGTLAAANMLGGDEAYVAVPWFWSDQYELCVQVAGLPSLGVETIAREEAGSLLLFHLDAEGRLVAASGVGPASIGRDIRIAEMLIARGACPDRARLASAATRLKSLLAA